MRMMGVGQWEDEDENERWWDVRLREGRKVTG
jgi:hypothetical protein